MMKKFTFILLCLVIGISTVVAQNTKVAGSVISADDGLPVIGASIVVKGTMVGIVTDYDGNFTLEVPSNGKVLIVSYVGMLTQEVPVSPNVRVVLKSDTQNLDEVVVTAMGISKEKKALGYAVQDVKGEKLTQAANSNLAGALQGKVSGLDIKPSSGMPGASSQITIRGARSFSGDNTPLYVIDGMPVTSTPDVDTDLQNNGSVSGADFANRAVDIDPNDIESINILKGQAASALYGIRASNGVIVITTKSGKGLAKGKPQISFSSNLSFDVIGRLPEFQKTYAQGASGKYSPTNSLSWGPKITDLPNDPTYGGNTSNAYTKEYGNHEGMYYQPQRAAAGLDPWTTPQAYDNAKDFFDTGVTWSNSINVAQALDKSSYSVSLGNTHQDGIIPSTGMDRYNVKVSAETKLHDNWTTGFIGNYITTAIDKAVTSGNGLLRTVYSAPPSYDLAGIPSHIAGDPYTQNSFRGAFDQAYWAMDNNKFTENTNRFFGNAYANYKTKFGTTDHTLNVRYMFGVDSYTTDYVDSYGYGSNTGGGKGQIENYGWTNATYNSLLTINYDWNINEDWGLNVVAGNEVIQSNRGKYYEYGTGYNFPGWNHIDNATTQSTSSEHWKKRTVGFFGNVSASYKNMLYLTVTGRQDYVSSMPRGNRAFFYPSVSAGFILTELDALKNDVVNHAKIRASYAEVGQAGDFRENFYSVPTYGGGFYSLTPILYPINGSNGYTPYYKIYDPNLKPQNTRSYELGTDLSLFDNLVTLNYTFSRQNVKDQIFDVPLASSTGAGKLVTNGGKLHTNVHEITLSFNPIRTRDINWDFGFNWTKIDNYVDELAPGVENISLGGYVTPQVRAAAGEKYPVIYGVGYKRDANGNRLVDENGLPIAGEAQVIGKVSPDFIMGFNTTLRLWDCTISAVLDWKQGGQMYSRTSGLADYYGVSKRTENREGTIIFDGYKEDGTKNDIGITGANAQQEYYSILNNIDESSIYDNSFIKLREVAVSYPVFKSNWMQVTLNVFARNVLIWAQVPDLDPEASQGNNNMSGAFEDYSMPQTASYGFGVNVKF
ncbi:MULTISPECIES: SusC/RagA family TonB-linked outer membrane protein [Parabacteroides]|uniref:SusC/RagA family TonB-linked outer membrane protein n=8 Tax=Parabacteroides goldsteinii TaxID=328812 RepID=A0A6G1ZB71_9BACT|nr:MULTISPECIES: SusC/RagA family TonB-linked outer membrane protein [Parabacteroides]EOS18373.1 SusC/RagA family TonB-linked outer membrane protein [Parabacteroides goldsteinii dnLKV18]KAI4362215.1 TonB-dependent receptor SusC [Parabacteroides sp. ASF519]MBF0765248.1 SusC/RagA family TonB-linked outer membrane protein [Parabacteroides goldsteinii]MDZ3928147.1 SusC/RagA family TonB-linked outer membrane protein [Parabacteroides goldsteinii]MRX94187.1 SusC/RagA family TonB-linked outer membrane